MDFKLIKFVKVKIGAKTIEVGFLFCPMGHELGTRLKFPIIKIQNIVFFRMRHDRESSAEDCANNNRRYAYPHV